jgi:hypothetical protein
MQAALQLVVHGWQNCDPNPATATGWAMFGTGLCTAIDELGPPPQPVIILIDNPKLPDTYPVRHRTAAVATAVAQPRRLLGWLARSRPARTLRPVYQPVADRLRWWTRGPHPRLLQRIADSSSGESVLRLLELAPATERSTGPRPVASLRDVLDTLDATRGWLQQHPQAKDLA